MKNEFEDTYEAEESFIGMLLADPDCAAQLDQYPNREWFLNNDLGKISEAINKMNTVDLFEISDVTGIKQAELMKLQIRAPVSHNPNAYAKEIFSNHKGRKITAIAQKWNSVKKYSKAFFESVDTDMNTLQELSGGVHDVIFADQALDEWMADKEKRICGEIKPVPSGFPSLDRLFGGGLHRGDLITVAGRPGSGKSAFLKSGYVNMALNNPDLKVAIFSIEMSPNEYLDRMCSEYIKISGTKLREAVHLTNDELDRMMEFRRNFHNKNFSFNRIQACTAFEIVRLAKSAMMRMGGLDAIFIDHLHIVKNHDKRLMEQAMLAEQTITFKRLAQDLDVPVVLAAQCNREQEKRADKTPQMSDLRGSGAIEQDSNGILFIHRPGLYDMAVDASIAEVALRKNRHGPSPAKLTFKFVPEFTSFVEMAQNSQTEF